MDTFTLIALFLCMVAALLIIKIVSDNHYMKRFRMPPVKPFVGNMMLFSRDPVQQFSIVNNLLMEYGSPLTMKFLSRYHTVVFKAEHVERILKSNVNITKGFVYNFLQAWLQTGLLTSTGQKWHNRRKLLTPSFHFQILRDFVPIFNKHSAILCEKLDDVSASDEGNGAIEIGQYLTLTTLDAICETAMGTEINALAMSCDNKKHHPYVSAILAFSELMFRRLLTLNPLLLIDAVYKWTEDGKRNTEALNTLHDFTRQIIAERDAISAEDHCQVDAGDSPTKRRVAFLDHLLQIKRNGDMTLEDVKEEVDTFMFEGHDTTSTQLKYALYCIGRHNDVQQKLRQEVDHIFGGMGTDITMENLNKTQYLDLVLKETQRLYPSVPAVVRTLETDQLVGQKFAVLEMKTILVDIIRNFEIESVQDESDLNETFLLIMRPMNGIWIKLKRRN